MSHYFEIWPPSAHECALVQSLRRTWWRLLRIPQLEAALYAKGRSEFVDIDPHRVKLETYLKYEKQFRNLALQERRDFNYAQRLKTELEEARAEHNRLSAAELADDLRGARVAQHYQPAT